MTSGKQVSGRQDFGLLLPQYPLLLSRVHFLSRSVCPSSNGTRDAEAVEETVRAPRSRTLRWEMTLKECVGPQLCSFGGVVPFLQNMRVRSQTCSRHLSLLSCIRREMFDMVMKRNDSDTRKKKKENKRKTHFCRCCLKKSPPWGFFFLSLFFFLNAPSYSLWHALTRRSRKSSSKSAIIRFAIEGGVKRLERERKQTLGYTMRFGALMGNGSIELGLGRNSLGLIGLCKRASKV